MLKQAQYNKLVGNSEVGNTNQLGTELHAHARGKERRQTPHTSNGLIFSMAGGS